MVHHLYFSSPILYSFVHKIVFFLLSLYAQGYSTLFLWMLHSSWFCVFLLRGYLLHILWGIYWFHIYSIIWSKNVIVVWTKLQLIWIWKIFSQSTKFENQDNFQRIRPKLYSLLLILWIIQLKIKQSSAHINTLDSQILGGMENLSFSGFHLWKLQT